MAKLRSGISKYYRKYFILEEDSLRRVQAVFQKAAKELPDSPEVVFRVEREDDRFYESIDIDDVLSDPNIKGRRVGVVYVAIRPRETQLEIDVKGLGDIASVKFAAEDKSLGIKSRNEIHLEISYDNKNWALLLADEIEPQIQRTFKAKGIPRWIFLPFLIPLAIVFIKLYQKLNPEISIIQAAKTIGVTYFIVLSIIFVISLLISIEGPPLWYSRLVGPESGFLWGDQIHAYNIRQKTRENIFWGVVVAFVVSFAAGGLWLIF